MQPFSFIAESFKFFGRMHLYLTFSAPPTPILFMLRFLRQ
jgi:hypothetical protein